MGSLTAHESALERDFIILASFLDARASIIAQPITINFRDKGFARHYTADFLVHWSSRPTELVEVKYQADLGANARHLAPAFEAAREWASGQGASFRIATEREIRGPLLDIAKRLLPLRCAPLDRKAAVRVLTATASLTMPTFGRIVNAVAGIERWRSRRSGDSSLAESCKRISQRPFQ